MCTRGWRSLLSGIGSMRESERVAGMRHALLLVAMLLFAVTLYYGVIFQGQLPDHPLLRGKNDLFLHFGAFLALTIPLRLLWPGWLSLVGLVVCAAGIEIVQIFVPARTAAFDDVAASLAGVLAGAALVALLLRGAKSFSVRHHE